MASNTSKSNCYLSTDDFNQVSLACQNVSPHWTKLAKYLNIDRSIVEGINKQGGGRDTVWCLDELIAAWLRQTSPTQPKPSWRILCDAVSNIDRPLSEKIWTDHTSACSLCSKVVCDVVDDETRPRQQPAAERNPMHVLRQTPVAMAVQQGNAIEAAKELENDFDDLVEFLITEISKINVDMLRYQISKHFEKEEGTIDEEIEKHLMKIEDCDKPSAILNYFRRHRFIGYINYSLIKVFQEIVKSPLLSKRIEEYEKDYQCFLELSLMHIHDAFQQCPDLRPDYPAGIPKFTIHLKSKWDGKRMFNLKEFLKQCFSDSDCVDQLMIAKISRNCIIITFAVLPHIAKKVLGYLTNYVVITSMKKEGISVDISKQLMKYEEELEPTTSTEQISENLGLKTGPPHATDIKAIKPDWDTAVTDITSGYGEGESLTTEYSQLVELKEDVTILKETIHEIYTYEHADINNLQKQIKSETVEDSAMAKGQLTMLDDQLTCSVCLDQYTNPKTLPCLHSFCLHCIEPLSIETKDRKCYISCPTCRVDHLLPQGEVRSLPNAFHIHSLFDVRKKFLMTILIPSTCPQHNYLTVYYCETCDQVICRNCTISAKHNTHIFCLISECYPKYHQQILGNLDLVKHNLDDMNTAMTHLTTREKKVFEQGENVKEQINAHAQQLIDNIQQSRTHLTQQVDTIVQQKMQTLATQRQQAQKLHTQLKTCQDTIEHSLKEWNQQQILTQKNTMMEEMKTVTQYVDPAVFQPIEDANIQFNKNEKDMGSITSIVYGKATLEASPCMVKQPAAATLTLHQSQDGSPFSLPPSLISSSTLSSPGDKHSVKCSITQTQPGKYNITFTPSTRKDQLIVQVGGVDVPDSPFTLPVIPPPPEMRGKPVNIITGLNEPWGTAVCDNGKIVVAEFDSHCVSILNKNREKVTMLEVDEDGPFRNNPRGVAVSRDGNILVTDNHRLRKLTTDGVCVKSVGSAQSGCCQLEFHSPIGIAVTDHEGRDQQIFVADYFNNRIQVFTNDLTFSHTITPSIKFPYDIAIDDEGYLYVTEYSSHSITKVTDKGKKIRTFGGEGSGPGQLSSPTFLTIHNNLVYVCEYGNNRVSVFDTDGKFRHQFGGDELLNRPQGIAMDTFGNLYVCDTRNNRIVVF